MILRGHGVEIGWDGQTLVARGTTAEGRQAVNAPEGSDRVELTVAQIDAAVLLEAPRRVGGVLIVVERDLEEHRLHFRRDTRLEFAALAAELDEAIERQRRVPAHLDLTDRSTPTSEADTAVSA